MSVRSVTSPCASLSVPAEESKGWSATIFYLLYSLIGKALQANIEAIQRATKLLEKQSDTLTSVMKQKIRELEESKNSFFRYEGLKLYLFWGGMVCNILVFLMLAYSLFGK